MLRERPAEDDAICSAIVSVRISHPHAPHRLEDGHPNESEPGARSLLNRFKGSAASGHGVHVGKRDPIEHLGHCVAHLRHQQADRAGFHVLAVPTRLISRPAGAADRGQRPVDRADHLADLDLGGCAREAVAAAWATGVAQFAENGIEKFLRDVVRLCDVDRLLCRSRLERAEGYAADEEATRWK